MKKISLIILTAIIAFSCADKKEKSTLEQLISNKKNIESKIDSLSIELKSVEQKNFKIRYHKKSYK
jgi:hypothetical protein